MSEIILHHYPPSPVSEKIRTGPGLKQLSWRSVEQSRLPDRPELFAMTGGYRRIPVMQLGADIYCDSLCILTELERLHPPALLADRARLYLGPDGSFADEVKDLPHVLAQFRAQLGWLETRLQTGRDYMGAIRSVGRDHISLNLQHPLCGDVAVHFPRVGYRVTLV